MWSVEAAPDRLVCPTCGAGASQNRSLTGRPLGPAREASEERFFLGLRLAAGIRPTPGEWLRFGPPIRRFLDAGLLETEGGAIRLTNRGVLFSNEVFQEFIGL